MHIAQLVTLRAALFQRLAVAGLLMARLSTIPLAARSETTADFYLRAGDRVVFYGDSITEQGYYCTNVQEFVAACCPDLDVTFINSGWSGDRAWGGEGGMLEDRLRRDVIAFKPTVVTVMLGMNDAYYTNYDAKSCEAYVQSIEALIEKIRRECPRVRITLIGTSPYDDISPGPKADWEQGIEGGYNSVLQKFNEALQSVADRRAAFFIDMNQPLVRLLEQARDADPELVSKFIPDRIHPGPAAGLVMAAHLLNAWKAPCVDSMLNIDAETGKVVVASGVRVSDVTLAGGLRWTLQDFALPFPMDRSDALVAVALRHSSELRLLCRQRLRITNISGATASLAINGQDVGSFSAKQWGEGVDLAAQATPMTRQAMLVAELIRLHSQLRFARWRRLNAEGGDVVPPPNSSSLDNDLASLEGRVGDLSTACGKPMRARFEVGFSRLH